MANVKYITINEMDYPIEDNVTVNYAYAAGSSTTYATQL